VLIEYYNLYINAILQALILRSITLGNMGDTLFFLCSQAKESSPYFIICEDPDRKDIEFRS